VWWGQQACATFRRAPGGRCRQLTKATTALRRYVRYVTNVTVLFAHNVVKTRQR
jgi:hypothetical protein